MRGVQPIPALLVAALLCSVVGVTAAREVTVKLKGGGEVVGELLAETSDRITIRLSDGTRKDIPRARIQEQTERLTLEEEYRQKRSAVGERDYDERFEIARWLYKIDDPARQREALRLAVAELDDLLKLNRDPEAVALRDVALNKLRQVEKSQGRLDAPARPDGEAPANDEDEPAAPGEPRLLTEAEINRMKVFEVDPSTKPNVVISPKVVDEFLNEYLRQDPVPDGLKDYLGREGERRFKTLKGHEQLELMFDVRARKFYDKVVVRDEPASLRDFRTRVNGNYLVRYCGNCHAGGKAKGLNLFTRGKPEEVAYSNLMVVASTELGDVPLLLTDDPDRSPLLHLGLPAKDTGTPHPDVQGWRPYFRNRDDPKFQAMVEWVESLATSPREMLPAYPGELGDGGDEPTGDERAPEAPE